MYLIQDIPPFRLYGDGESKEAIIDLNAWPFNIEFHAVGIDRVLATTTGAGGDNPVEASVVDNGVVKLVFAGIIAAETYRTVNLTVHLDVISTD